PPPPGPTELPGPPGPPGPPDPREPASSEPAPSLAAPVAPAPDRAGGPDLLAADVLAMIQRLDERCVRSEATLAELLERTERLERRGAVQGEELRAQRTALARLDRALGRPLGAGPRADFPLPPRSHEG